MLTRDQINHIKPMIDLSRNILEAHKQRKDSETNRPLFRGYRSFVARVGKGDLQCTQIQIMEASACVTCPLPITGASRESAKKSSLIKCH